jgi:hypothetical protein
MAMITVCFLSPGDIGMRFTEGIVYFINDTLKSADLVIGQP